MKTIALLGSTGSIGSNVLEVVRRYPDRFRVASLTAGNSVASLADQVVEFNPEFVSIGNGERVNQLRELLPEYYHDRILTGDEGNCEAARLSSVDMVVTAVAGSVGLLPTLAALDAGKDIGLANKETLVMAGQLVMERARAAGIRILPIDSEHSAIFQALAAGRKQDVRRLLLTASGGPFRQLSADKLDQVTPEQALAHPNWDMGRKISIDSATLMNKGLEVIEARWLFDITADQIEVVVHPQSIVHSLVEYNDGSIIAQMGIPDMQIPIAYALSYPERLDLGNPSLDLAACEDLTFEAPDTLRFPSLLTARECLQAGGVMTAVLNAANEVAVDAFLQKRIGFMDIHRVVSIALGLAENDDPMQVEAILHADSVARLNALAEIKRLHSK
ncbi:MAG: 1-deoxy-D-xylulose-5-phosphate reductoisomerase [Desulfobulbus propionicus]|nr:MAG: 1-deoxy-D-xylulose-5-phosphate reductoisomerase [Desulfobulbus propionicus]